MVNAQARAGRKSAWRACSAWRLASWSWPDGAALAWLVLVTTWATLVGALRILAAIRPRREIQGERMLALSGEALTAFAVLLALFPGAGVLARVKMLGIFALLVGILLFVLVVEQRRQLKLFSWQAHLRAVRARSKARRRLKQQAILTDIRLIGLGFDDEATASAV